VTFAADVLADLPASATAYSIFDSSVPELISDRVDGGGPFAGEAARIGSHGSSCTPTRFRVGDADITDPNNSRPPLLVPGLLASVFAHIVYSPPASGGVRVVGWGQRTSSPFANRLAFGQPLATEDASAGHAQVIWERRSGPADPAYAAFASVAVRPQSADEL